MDIKIKQTRDRIALLEHHLKITTASLNAAINKCNHDWKYTTVQKTVKNPYVDYSRFTTQGIHIEYEMRYRDEIVMKHVRTCNCCGVSEETDKVKEIIKKVPDWS